MIIDLPPHIEKAIIAKAQEQGLTVQEMLTKDYDDIWQVLDQHGLNGEPNLTLSDKQAKQLADVLDNPPPPNVFMRELLAMAKGMSHV